MNDKISVKQTKIRIFRKTSKFRYAINDYSSDKKIGIVCRYMKLIIIVMTYLKTD